jgi:hypothetical protein
MNELLVPVSIGELYDKITILQIKKNKLKPKDDKLTNIQKELELLKDIAVKHPIDSAYFFELFNINVKIWNIEDKIRVSEKDADFGSDFIELARSVYHNNDERAKIKRVINIKYGSIIIEEKSYEEY